jgi:Protein of unknown function (DUF3551)
MSPRKIFALRAAIALAGCLAIAPLTVGPAQAQEYQGNAPWCANLGYLGTGWECAYDTLRQCMARASGITNSCSVNPWYVPERVQPRRQRRDRARDQ